VEKKSSSLYIPIEGQKHDKIKYLLTTTKRALPNENSINNTPLLYPADGVGFICTYSCKEMKDAGVSLQLAVNVIPSPSYQIDIADITQYQQEPEKFDAISFEGIELNEAFFKLYPITIMKNDSIVVEQKSLTFEMFLLTKRLYPTHACFVCPKLRFLIWSEHTAMSWNEKFQIFVSHTEMFVIFPKEFASSAKCLLAYNGKITDISCQLNFKYYIHLKNLFKYTHVYQYRNYVHIITCENILLKYHSTHNIYVSPHELNVLFQQQLKFQKGEEYYYFVNLFQELPPYANNTTSTKITVTFNNIRGSCYEIKNHEEYEAFLESPGYNTAIDFHGKYDYTDLAVLSCVRPKKRKFPHYPNIRMKKMNILRINVAFSHDPSTVEDGFVIDSKFAANGPRLKLVINLTTRIMFNNSPLQLKDMKNLELKYHQINQRIGNIIYFGVLSAKNTVKILPNKKIKVSISKKLNGFIHYTLSYSLEYTYENYEISSYDHFTTAPLITKRILYEIPIGVGTKLCNAFGQKGEIAKVQDLSKYKGFKSDKTCVHPQLLMSAISLVGRTAAGQVRQMHDSEDCAYTENGELIAPCDIWVSSIHASNKIGTLSTRIDALKMCNGFDGNKLSTTNMLLSQQSTEQSKWENLQHALTLNEHKGIKFSWDNLFT
jgi:hypothetical protein